MAGGRGQRLHPLTEHTPKPMLHVGQKPMLQVIIEGYIAQGFKEFTLAVCYRRKVIEDYFEDGAGFGCSIEYIEEHEPMGTAGGLSLLPDQSAAVIMQNADVLTHMDYKRLLAQHNAHDSVATVCLALHQYQVPFGVVETEGSFVTTILEKPICDWLVNAGIYVLAPEFIRSIPKRHIDMNDALAAAPGFVRYFQLTEPWSDVGRFEDLVRANGGG